MAAAQNSSCGTAMLERMLALGWRSGSGATPCISNSGAGSATCAAAMRILSAASVQAALQPSLEHRGDAGATAAALLTALLDDGGANPAWEPCAAHDAVHDGSHWPDHSPGRINHLPSCHLGNGSSHHVGSGRIAGAGSWRQTSLRRGFAADAAACATAGGWPGVRQLSHSSALRTLAGNEACGSGWGVQSRHPGSSGGQRGFHSGPSRRFGAAPGSDGKRRGKASDHTTMGEVGVWHSHSVAA